MNVKTLTYRIQLSDKNSYLFNRYETLEVCTEIQPGDNLTECAIELIKIGNNSLFNPHRSNKTELKTELIPEVEDYIPTDNDEDEDEIPY